MEKNIFIAFYSKRCASHGELILPCAGWERERQRLQSCTQNSFCHSSHSLSFKSLLHVHVILDRTLPKSRVFLGLVCHVLSYSISMEHNHNWCLQWRNQLQVGFLFRGAWGKLSKQIAQSALGRVNPQDRMITEHPSFVSRGKIQIS